MLNSADYYRFSDLYSVYLSFKLSIFSEHIGNFKIRVLKVQDFGNFELSPMDKLFLSLTLTLFEVTFVIY